MKKKQRFNVSHLKKKDFRKGLRSYAQYRDLGMAKATHGMVQAHVIRLIPPCDPKEVSQRHYHEVDLQLIYVLKGWIRSEFEGRGEVLESSSCEGGPRSRARAGAPSRRASHHLIPWFGVSRLVRSSASW